MAPERPTVRGDLRALGRWLQANRPHARGVTVYTGLDAEFYRTGDHWTRDEKGVLDIFNWRDKIVATFLPNTWVRVEAGPPASVPPNIPRNE